MYVKNQVQELVELWSFGKLVRADLGWHVDEAVLGVSDLGEDCSSLDNKS